MRILVFAILLVFIFACNSDTGSELENIDLSGEWTVVLDADGVGERENWYNDMPEGQAVSLPGTLDEAGIGTPNTMKPELNNQVLSHLTRKNEYIGPAWYSRTINLPDDWTDGAYELELERVLWESTVWVNGKETGKNYSLIAPHRYAIGELLQAGENNIVIRIDNSDFYPNINVTSDRYPVETSLQMAHAYTNHTQIKWNGILGDIAIREIGDYDINNLRIDADAEGKTIVFSYLGNKTSAGGIPYTLTLNGDPVQKGEVEISGSNNQFKGSINLEKEPQTWDEFNPNLYELHLGEKSKGGKSTTFGFTDISSQDGQLTLNGQRIYLRGTLECSIFPLTGRPPMAKAEWLDLYAKAKDYGLNHFRFHSWCPPKAAFEAADEIGFYLQAELPHWSLVVGTDSVTNDYLRDEGDRLLAEYGNHPSFILMSLGNELQGELSFLNELTAELKAADDRRLYSATTFSFQEGAGALPQPEDEFFVTQWTEKGWVRGQGIFNARAPHFDKDYRNEIDHITQPLISHEIGQYSVYPDLAEIEQYTGVLDPLNFKAVKQDLERKGLLDLAPDFTRSSVALANILYKEEIERALKTPGFDGFQLLQLQDFPGQGTALVGLLNAFWEPKGDIDAKEFKTFSGPVVPLLRFSKAVFTSGETFEAQAQVANFHQPMNKQTLEWRISSGSENIAEGTLDPADIALGNENFVGEFSTVLFVDRATELIVSLAIEDSEYVNSWSIWVYPKAAEPSDEDVVYTRDFNEAADALGMGKTVLLNPDFESLAGVTGRFVPVFWSPVHFPDQPSTMGILCNPDHAAFSDFPTDSHTDWQWWDLNIQSKALILDDLNVNPLVRVIDNFVTNRSLGTVFEAKVGSGKLIFSSIDLFTSLEDRHAARQLRHSLESYMASDDFSPKVELEFGQIEGLQAKK
ncbi:MAG: sugar-binding domain-containing protein [Bacteroidota bacterium]